MVYTTENDIAVKTKYVDKHNSESHIDHLSHLKFDAPLYPMRLIGIICSVGPSCEDVDTLEKIIANGCNIFRLNCSHETTYEYLAKIIKNIHLATESYSNKMNCDVPIGIALDTRGAEIRTGYIVGNEVELKKNNKFKITTNKDFKSKGDLYIVYVDYINIVNVIKPGNIIHIDNATISVVVIEINDNIIDCIITKGGILKSSKGVNLPGVAIDLPAISEKDKNDILFGIQEEIDVIFMSFVRSPEAIFEIRKLLGEKGKKIKVIAKIENEQGLNNLDAIIRVSDGIMISRGDLGIEIPTEQVFVAQKSMIAKCNMATKPVICAKQMLESMIKKPIPTRAELSDIANATLDGADCLMLTGETAIGLYPIECVRIMSATCKEAEVALWHKQIFHALVTHATDVNSTNSVAIAAVEASHRRNASAIICLTISGRTAHLLSKYRPRCPIIAVTRIPQVARQLHLYRGVLPVIYKGFVNDDWRQDVNSRVQDGIRAGNKHGFVEHGDPVIIVTGWKQGVGFTNTMRIINAVIDDNIKDEECECVQLK